MRKILSFVAGRMGRRTLLVGAVAIAAAAGVGGASYTLTSQSTGTTTATTAKSHPHHHAIRPHVARLGLLGGVLRRTSHAELELKTAGGWVTVDIDRGVVTTDSSGSITIHRPDGATVTDAITSSTHLPKAGLPKMNESVVIISENGSARRIAVLGKKAMKAVTGGVNAAAIAATG